MALTPSERTALEAALADGFPAEPSLRQVLESHLNFRLNQVVAAGPLDRVIHDLVDEFEGRGATRALIRLLDEERGGNPNVVAFIRSYPSYPRLLNGGERERFREGLASVAPTWRRLRRLLRDALALEGEQLFGAPIQDGDPVPPGDMTWLVRWLDYMDRVEDLLSFAQTRFSDDAVFLARAGDLLTLVGARKRAAKIVAGPSDPFTACELDGKHFIDRRDLREALRKIGTDATLRVLAIAGPRRSGKSHSRYLIEHVGSKERRFEAAVIELESDESPAVFAPDLLVKRIVRLMGRNTSIAMVPRREDSAGEVRWVKDLAEFVVGEVKAAGRPLLVVLDGFSDPNLMAPTRDLVRQLVKHAATQELLRVALLGSADDLIPPEASGRLAREVIGAFDDTALRDFFLRLAASRPGDPPPLAESLDAVIGDIRAMAAVGAAEGNEARALRAAWWVRELYP